MWVLCGLSLPLHANAQDVRLALLVGNQYGWSGEPHLKHVIKGDLEPMKQALVKSGFKVFALLSNQSADSLRKTFKKLIARSLRHPRPTTFFFYYSGHADKAYFHMGPRIGKPLSYREFVSFLDKLRVKRRFAIIDACFSGEVIRKFGDLRKYQNLLNKGKKPKGVSLELEERDLRKHLPNQGQQVRGLQILSSSRGVAFESSKRRASVFTYHLLKGLKGEADIDKDGKISFNELFLYAKPKVQAETGQSPQQWLFRVGGDTYGFAPVYQGKLHIESNLTGKLRVKIGRFYWQQSKKKGALHLAVTTGKGYIHWQQGKICRHQSAHFTKGGKVSLKTHQGWTQISCKAQAFTDKGSVQLPLTEYEPFQKSHRWNFSLQSGIWAGSSVLHATGELAGAIMPGLRLRNFGLFVNIWGTSLTFHTGSYLQFGIELRGEAGFRRRWSAFELFAGGYLALGLLLQDANRNPSLSPYTHFGPTLSFHYWLSSTLALTLSVDFGLWPTMTNDAPNFPIIGAIRLGLLFG